MADVGGIAGDQLRSTVSDFIAELDAEETWRPIAGFDGYRVSSQGKVKGPRRDLKPVLTGGYLIVSLVRRDGVTKTARVHQLVARAFLGDPPFEGALVAHNDGVSHNNRVSNLRWASAKENQADRSRHRTVTCGSKVYGAKLKEEDIPAIRARIGSGERYPTIAADYGVSVSTISLIKKDKIWRRARGAAWSRPSGQHAIGMA